MAVHRIIEAPTTTHRVHAILLEKSYVLRKRAEVLRFLEECPFLMPLLHQAHLKIEEYFPGSKAVLALSIDPEDPAGNEFLVASISPQSPPAEAVESFNRFIWDWWLDVRDSAKEKLLIKIGF